MSIVREGMRGAIAVAIRFKDLDAAIHATLRARSIWIGNGER